MLTFRILRIPTLNAYTHPYQYLPKWYSANFLVILPITPLSYFIIMHPTILTVFHPLFYLTTFIEWHWPQLVIVLFSLSFSIKHNPHLTFLFRFFLLQILFVTTLKSTYF
jgi:hypothetical protein